MKLLFEDAEIIKLKVKISKESLRQALILFTYLKPYRGKFILSLVFIAISAFTTSLFPFFLGKMIDAASAGATASGIGSNFGSQLGFGLKDIHWSLNTTLLLIFAQLSIQTIFSFMRVYLLTEGGHQRRLPYSVQGKTDFHHP